MADGRVRLDIDGPIATITNDNPGKHNAFDDAMDVALFEILGELAGRPDLRAVIWRAEGKSFSSGRDVSAIGGGEAGLTHHELMKRGHEPSSALPSTPGADMSDTTALPGLPEPPPAGSSALPAGTFDGVAVLVTGGGTGLGRAIAAEFARLGAGIVIASRKPEYLGQGETAIKEIGGRVVTAVCDIRDPAAVAAAFDAAEQAFGLPQVLVNNAGANFPVPAEDMSPNAWRSVVDITLNGTFFCAREFGRRHLATGTPGSIINVGASYAWTGGPGFAHSAAAKAGVKNMTETLAVEWGPYGIQVNGLVPGMFPHEDMTADIKGNLARSSQTDKDRAQPALRTGRLRELGWAATFLASPYARFISGHTLVVDGANWQRRSLTNAPVITVRDQMGKGEFAP